MDLRFNLDNTAQLRPAMKVILPGPPSGSQYVWPKKLGMVPKFFGSYKTSYAPIRT